MNGLEIAVIIIIAVCVLAGYYVGFLRVLYSLAAWILVLAFVTWTTPYMADFLEKNTGIKEAIQEKCIDYMAQMTEEKISQGAEEYGNGQQQNLENPDIFIPISIIEQVTGNAAIAVGEILKDSGLYEEMAEKIARFIIEGIAFFITMTVAGILTFWISRMLDIISRIPVLRGPNKALGAVAGGLKGLVITWLLFYFIDLCAASEFGKQLHIYIEESWILSGLYQYNILFQIIRVFI